MRLRVLGVGASDGTFIKSTQINKSEILEYRYRTLYNYNVDSWLSDT